MAKAYPAGGYSPSAHAFGVTPPTVSPETIAASGTYQTGIIAIIGYPGIGIACQLTQVGSISVQRYLDAAGTIPTGSAITATLTANTLGVANITNDGVAWLSYQVTITSSGGATATVTTFAMTASAF